MHGEHSKLTFGECGCRLESGNEYSIWHVHTKCAVGWKQATYTACGTYTLGRLVKFYCPDYQMFDNFPFELILLREILQQKAT